MGSLRRILWPSHLIDLGRRVEKAESGTWLRDHHQQLLVQTVDITKRPRVGKAKPFGERVQHIWIAFERQPGAHASFLCRGLSAKRAAKLGSPYFMYSRADEAGRRPPRGRAERV